MAAAQTGSNTISAHRTARNKITTITSIFSMSPGSTTLLSTQPEITLYRKRSTSGLEAAIFLLPVYSDVQTT